MSALPGQDVYSWKNTLKKVMMLKPEHISAYSLIIEKGTPFYERFGEPQRKLDCGAQMAGTLPAPKTAAEMAARAAAGRFFVPAMGYTAACFASPAAWVCADLFLVPACAACIRRLRRLCPDRKEDACEARIVPAPARAGTER